MQIRGIEIFYLFFQGILCFQVLLFVVLYFITRKRDLLYYCVFLFFAAVYFFINAPYTFFGIPEDVVWNSVWYDYANTPVIIIENLFYLLFLKAFYENISSDKIVTQILNFILWLIPIIIFLFLVLTLLNINKQFIFYTVKMIAVLPAILVAYIIIKRRPPFAQLVANGLICTVVGTSLTVGMIILGNYGVHHLFTENYPLFFIRLGILGDMIFYLSAILKKWHLQEKLLATEKLRSELAVEQMRNKISGELHDDLGSSLSGISMYSHMMSDFLRTGKYKQAEESANIIQESATEMVSSLHELVWSISPGGDSIEKLVEKLEEYAAKMAAAGNMKIRMSVSNELSGFCLSVESRRNIYLFCKEAINNSVKYSMGNQLELAVTNVADNLQFSVSDNGKGFEEASARHGHGLMNMQKRANEIGGKFTLYTKPGEGTFVSIEQKCLVTKLH